MQLRDVGEFELIARIAKAAAREGAGRDVVIGIGDDGAVLRPRREEDLVVTTDSLVEGVHFRWSNQGPTTLGRRALAVNLSDLAAMGARPLGFTVALVAPPALELRRFDGLARGLLQEARRYACPWLGGNLSRGRETSLAVTALGAVARGRALRRRGSRPGDRIWVTGQLGAAALERAKAEGRAGRIRRVPTPRLRAGRALARLGGVGGCIDLSDGLEADLDHLLEPEGLAGELDLERIPRPRGFAAACARLGREAAPLLLAGGEDYELLFTLRPAGPSAATLARRLGCRVTEIGRVVPGGRRRSRRRAGGWRHF